jgi:hypothetical protein
MTFNVLICMFCGSAWAPSALLGHCKNVHPNMKRNADAQSKLDEVVLEYGIVSEVDLPEFNGIPVEGLMEHKDGLICKAPGCNYACRKASVMDKHWSQSHRSSRVPVQDRHHTGVVQLFFTGTGHRYFLVNPSLKEVDPEGLYATFIRDYLPSLPPLPMLPPDTYREVPPLLAHTGWNLHLDTFVTDEAKRKALVASAIRPLDSEKDALYGQLHDWVFEYMDSIRDIAQHKVPYTLLRYILQYPW